MGTACEHWRFRLGALRCLPALRFPVAFTSELSQGRPAIIAALRQLAAPDVPALSPFFRWPIRVLAPTFPVPYHPLREMSTACEHWRFRLGALRCLPAPRDPRCVLASDHLAAWPLASSVSRPFSVQPVTAYGSPLRCPHLPTLRSGSSLNSFPPEPASLPTLRYLHVTGLVKNGTNASGSSQYHCKACGA